MQRGLNTKTVTNEVKDVSIVKGMILFLLVSALFFAGMINFANAQQKATLEWNLTNHIDPTNELTFQYLGTESGPQLRKLYLAQADGNEYIVRVYQDNRTILDAFNLNEYPQLVEQFQEKYSINW